MTAIEHIRAVAQYCFDNFGDDYYEALNAAECVATLGESVEQDAFMVHAILEGEV